MNPSAAAARPEVGAWYEDPTGRRFEVASVDLEAGLIQVRYEDEETAEIDLADWRHAMVDQDALPEEPLTAPADDRER